MYTCEGAIRVIYPYLDGELEVEETGRLQIHLQECPCCRAEFASEHSFLDLVRSQMSVISTPTKACNF
ncbi:MAG TPA: zf-HC2 domain-containing protein [Nitrospiria bacterium]|nr:zf-HC2 domain-containing protein [Nitrospiria bacterium]